MLFFGQVKITKMMLVIMRRTHRFGISGPYFLGTNVKRNIHWGLIHFLIGLQHFFAFRSEIGRASCRESVQSWVGAISAKKKLKRNAEAPDPYRVAVHNCQRRGEGQR